METWVAITKLYLVLLWRKTKILLGRLFWFWITYTIGMAVFASEIPAAALAGIVAVMTYYVQISDEELEESVRSITQSK